MDLNRIFMKNAAPTKVGGQAILEGIMMRGSRALSVAIREPSGDIHLTVEPLPAAPKWKRLPIIRGVLSFVSSLITGTSVLTYGAEVLEKAGAYEEENAEPGKLEKKLDERFGEGASTKVALGLSVVLALVMVVGIFILLPTGIMSLFTRMGIHNPVLLNLIEGVLRIAMFVVYIALISKMPDIRRTFEYHGAEHKSIHCYENGVELTPENAAKFYRLHPRCGTSFMMFVMVISLLIFSFFGWPNLAVRILSRLALIPVVAGISYEVLQFTGRHANACVKGLSLPGIALQQLTTKEPDEKQLEVAIAALNAVLPSHEDPDLPVEYWVGRIKPDGTMEKDEEETAEYIARKEKK